MKTHYISSFLLAMLLLGACSSEVSETITYKINAPVIMPAETFRSSVKVSQQAQSIKQQGKIAFYNGFMYISEPEKGIHIIDNRDPKKPQSIGFIDILGNVDMAIKDNTLYADSYIDLVWFDISNPSHPLLKGRKEGVFPTAYPQPNNTYRIDYQKIDEHKQSIVIGWEVQERTEVYTRDQSFWWWAEKADGAYLHNGRAGGGGNIGQTGSMARFAVYKDYLYTVLHNQLGIFNIKNPKTVEKIGNMTVGWNVETIFSYKDNMFMGTPSGMLIYSVKNPTTPHYLSSLQHVYGCDPVVVENDTAYVTVHSGNNCGQNNNQLIIIDVKDTKNPSAIVTYKMTKPKGLAIDNGTLFVCDDGLKVFNAKNPLTLMDKKNLYFHKQGMDGYDVIAFDRLLMMIAAEGIYQYDYTDIENIKQLSMIPIGATN